MTGSPWLTVMTFHGVSASFSRNARTFFLSPTNIIPTMRGTPSVPPLPRRLKIAPLKPVSYGP